MLLFESCHVVGTFFAFNALKIDSKYNVCRFMFFSVYFANSCRTCGSTRNLFVSWYLELQCFYFVFRFFMFYPFIRCSKAPSCRFIFFPRFWTGFRYFCCLVLQKVFTFVGYTEVPGILSSSSDSYQAIIELWYLNFWSFQAMFSSSRKCYEVPG